MSKPVKLDIYELLTKYEGDISGPQSRITITRSISSNLNRSILSMSDLSTDLILNVQTLF